MAAQIEHPFEIVLSDGSRAYADDEAGALAAVRQLREDHRDGLMAARKLSAHIVYEGRCVLTIDAGRSV